MSGVRIAVIVGLLALAGWVVLALFGAQVMPSYLASWLFWISIPLGALPLVMILEALGDTGAMTATLRRLLPLLPMGALLAIPFLLTTGRLFRRPGMPESLPGWWLAPGFFALRTVVILLVLSGLALLFAGTPTRPRRGLASVGLMLHVCLLSVAAADWVLSLQPGLGSSEIGLLLIAAQMGIAGCAAGFMLAFGSARAAPAAAARLLAVLLGAWVFLHFVQFLVVWSGNLPEEWVWYGVRSPGLGGFTIWFAAAAALLALIVLPTSLSSFPAVLASVAAMLLLVHLMEMFWLVTPAFRGGFTIGFADLLAAVGLGGLAVAGLSGLVGGHRAAA